MLTIEDRQEIEQLLYREAHLLDERRFREWLDLLTDDIEYLMPLTEHVQGKVAPAGHPIIKDDKPTLMAREAAVKSSFIVRQARKLRDEAWWVGRRHDRVRRVEDQWLIARRCIYLDATVLPRGVSIFF